MTSSISHRKAISAGVTPTGRGSAIMYSIVVDGGRSRGLILVHHIDLILSFSIDL